ncbi:MAG: hypothetical protein KBA81_04185 [Rhabdochlamydiaceae bacterium]|nr:hypothetical protein [Rhabdochlamydiaceae bacterium]
MKEQLSLHDQIKLDQESPNNDSLFATFWAKCKKLAPIAETKTWDLKLDELTQESWTIRSEFNRFNSFLKDVPIAAGLGHWIKGVITDKFWRAKYVPEMTSLIEKKLIPLLNAQGKDLTLNEFRAMGHEQIIENIRCVKEWTLFEKEARVQCYLQFSHSLANFTLNFIAPGFDPDRRRTSNRTIKYESFVDFILRLSPRDALIAELLYFGAPTIDEVLSLKKNAILIETSAIRFADKEIVFPKHLIQDLISYLEGKIHGKGLVFTNVRGAEVERAHLNQSFARACEKMISGPKITPGSLLKLENSSMES